MLFIVPTPIGNLEDFTFRAVKTLNTVNIILAEDTRTSKKLLTHYSISTPLYSFHAFNEHQNVQKWVNFILEGNSIALISDAGTPGISDPGFLIVRACYVAKVKVTCLPGANALIPAVVMSGFPCNKFHFEGFLPHKKGRKTRFNFLITYPYTIILYESPHRVQRLIRDAITFFGPERKIAICREISKIFEEVIQGSLVDVAEIVHSRKKIKGEIVIVFEPAGLIPKTNLNTDL